ncbi:MAG: type II secretion system protein N [Steroidobacteraceae bacterium]
MWRPPAWIAAGAVAFALVLVARFPARWAAFALPHGVACARISGTLWSGTCAGLRAARTPVGNLRWTLHALRLLTGELSLDVSLARAGGGARSRIDLSPSGSITARGLAARFALGGGLLRELLPSAHGAVEAHLSRLHWNGHRVTEIAGVIEVRRLTVGAGESLGDYQLSFPAGLGVGRGAADGHAGANAVTAATGDEPLGQLSDLGGPFSLQATVRLTHNDGYVVNGLIAARPGASPDLAAQLRYFGAPDAQGRRQFSIAGTF